MKIIITLLLLLQANLLSAQDTKNSKFQVNEISLKISSVQDLQEINWEEIKSIFTKNEEEEDVIKIGFVLDLQEAANKLNSSFVVSGKTKNLEDLIVKAQKGTHFLLNIATQDK